MIGTLENQSGEQRARQLFVLDGGEWMKTNLAAGEVPELQILSHGEPIGTLAGFEKGFQKYACDFGTLKMKKPPGEASLVKDDATKFLNWTGVPQVRPLILIGGLRDLKFDRVVLAESAPPFPWSELKKETLDAVNCKDLDSKPEKYVFQPSDFDIVDVVYGVEGTVVGYQPKSGLYKCDGPIDDAWSSHWFFIPLKGDIVALGPSLAFVDRVEDSSIHSPWLFYYSGYNKDGYVLFSDSFSKSVRADWHYH